MKVKYLVAEIGSTTTVVNAFGNNAFVGQGYAPTSVLQGDVRVGLSAAIKQLENKLGCHIAYEKMLATSSAAGGLKMTVHGLVYEMTARAAREAALGAGAIVKMTTAGKLTDDDIEQIRETAPNLILLAGGTDYGERETALYNGERIAKSDFGVPVLYAGNVTNRRELSKVFDQCGRQLIMCDNVYPSLDQLNIEPTRKIIHTTFEQHITQAKGMEHVREMVSGSIIPTPGAVMEGTMLLSEIIGDCVCVDIGGATTDVHSVTEGSAEIASISIEPEPRAKRTVEGDLGVFVNAVNLVELYGEERLSETLGFDYNEALNTYSGIPTCDKQRALIEELTLLAGKTALLRHIGKLRYIYNSSGRQTVAQGKDLSMCNYLVATGGALTRLPNRQRIQRELCDLNTTKTLLYPRIGQMKVLEDRHYIMASIGVIAKEDRQLAKSLLIDTLSLDTHGEAL